MVRKEEGCFRVFFVLHKRGLLVMLVQRYKKYSSNANAEQKILFYFFYRSHISSVEHGDRFSRLINGHYTLKQKQQRAGFVMRSALVLFLISLVVSEILFTFDYVECSLT